MASKTGAAKAAQGKLGELASKIKACSDKADNYRVTLAQHLAEARTICDENGLAWNKWLKEHFPPRSQRDFKRLVAIGKSSDPAKAYQKSLESRRVSTKKLSNRKQRLNKDTSEIGDTVSPPETLQIAHQPPQGPAQAAPPQSIDIAALDDKTARSLFRPLVERLGMRMCGVVLSRLLSIEEGWAMVEEIKTDLGTREAQIGAGSPQGDPQAVQKALVPQEPAALVAAPADDLLEIPIFFKRT